MDLLGGLCGDKGIVRRFRPRGDLGQDLRATDAVASMADLAGRLHLARAGFGAYRGVVCLLPLPGPGRRRRFFGV